MAPRLARRWVSWRNVVAVTPWAGGLLILGVILLIPIAGDINAFFSSIGVSASKNGIFNVGTLGNLLHPLPGIEAFGVWFSGDFRATPANACTPVNWLVWLRPRSGSASSSPSADVGWRSLRPSRPRP